MATVANARLGIQVHIKNTDKAAAEKFLGMLEQMCSISNVTVETTSIDFPVSAALPGSQKTLIVGELAETVQQAAGTVGPGQFDPSAILKGQ